MPRSQQRLPERHPWVTHEDPKGSRNQIEHETTPMACLDHHEQDHVASAGWDEDLEVLQENGELDEGDDGGVKDRSDIGELVMISVKALRSPSLMRKIHT